MTLDTTVRRINFQGDDRTTCFPFPFKVWGQEQVVVYCSDPETPWEETDITQQTTITLNADNYGGAVIFASAPSSNKNFAIVREGNFLQTDQYLSGSRFDAHEIEDRFDEDAAERQELLDATARSIKVPNSSTQTPEEVYQELVSGSEFVKNALESLTELYNQAVYYYNLTMGYLGDTSYLQSKEVSFTVDETHKNEWLCTLPNGFAYYPMTHQLLVTVDGLALTPETHFEEIGSYGTESDQIRFKINIYKDQQVYIKATFLGTEAFNLKIQEMNDRIEEANDNLQNIIISANRDFETQTNNLKDFVNETISFISDQMDEIDADLTQINNLIQEVYTILGTNESLDSFQGAINQLTELYQTFTAVSAPTQNVCTLNTGYSCNSCLRLPPNICYHPGSNTLHLAIDGIILSPTNFQEICNSNDTTCCVKLSVCLYCHQELYAWTENYLGFASSASVAYQPDITTRLYATSTSGYIYYSDDLGESWSSMAKGLQLPQYLQRQQIVATNNTLWTLATLPKGEDNSQEENDSENDAASNNSQATKSSAAIEPTSERILVYSTDGGLTWDYDQFLPGTPHFLTAIDDTLILATCQGLFCRSTRNTWDFIRNLDSNEAATITALAINKQGQAIIKAGSQTQYTNNLFSDEPWQNRSLPNDVNYIYTTYEGGFVALGSGAACIAAPQNAWKCSEGFNGTLCAGLHLPDHGRYLAVGGDFNGSYTLWSWDGLNWNCGCGVPNNAMLNNIWASEHLPFFTNEPITKLQPMSPAADLEDEDNSTSDGGQDDDNQEDNEPRYFWGPISPTYQLKSDLIFNSSSIPAHIVIDRDMPNETDGATIAIYKSDTYQRLTREDISIADGLNEGSQEQSSPQAWREFARYEACGPISANTELYTCFTAAGQSGSGEALTTSESSYPTYWPAGYYAAAIYCVYSDCSLQSSIPKINLYVSRQERYSSCAAGAEDDAAETV